jgi:hypothetical protein
VANLLVRPVAHKWFMSEADVTALQAKTGDAAVPQSLRATGVSLASALAWSAVGIPILWGVWITLDKVSVLFR